MNIVNHVTKNELNLDEELCENRTEKFDKNIALPVLSLKNTDNLDDFEAKYITEQIIKYKKEKNMNYNDFAILVRNNYKADIFEKELLKWGIPSIKKENTSFFKKPVIRNIISLLKFLQNIHNELELVRILKIKFLKEIM